MKVICSVSKHAEANIMLTEYALIKIERQFKEAANQI